MVNMPPGQFPGGQFPGGQFPGGGFPGVPGGFPGFPGGGFPGNPPGTPPGQQRQQQAPTSAPPQFIPEREQQRSGQFGIFAIDPGAIRGCLYNFTYVWLENGGSFWFYPTFVGRRSVAGFRWRPRRGWVYFGIDLDEIESFTCSPRPPRRRRYYYDQDYGYDLAYDFNHDIF